MKDKIVLTIADIFHYFNEKILAHRTLLEYAIEQIEQLECDADNSDLGCERRISGAIRSELKKLED
jgi:hypothetical protein